MGVFCPVVCNENGAKKIILSWASQSLWLWLYVMKTIAYGQPKASLFLFSDSSQPGRDGHKVTLPYICKHGF